MARKPRPLKGLDPHTVPLPHGTEVVLGAERTVAGKRVPQGALGRVMKSPDDAGNVEVMIVGVGVATYRRDELVPRKEGQARFARRRATDWGALAGCHVLEATVGSRAWGLADEGSDTDVRGLFALPFPWTTGLAEPPTDLVSVDGSATFWELGKALRQALRADPNTLETLFVPTARPLDELGQWVLETRDAFVSAQIYGSFGQYALSQLRRLAQSQRLAEHRAIVLEWLKAAPAASLDAIGERLARETGPSDADATHRAKQYVKQLYRSMYDQGLLAANDFAALVEFAQERSADFELPRELRPKNAYNLIRLIATATDWLRTGTPQLEARGVLRERLLAIKRGDVPLPDVLAEAEGMTPALEAAFRSTALPAHPNLPRAHALLRKCQLELASRWAGQKPGPFGVDAPAPPGVEGGEP
ncbi:MAG: nucleotidyltransferase domain-containing protein [Deltaproteobacteria bacterium]|nr:nucleotidyltransferase domain-containing protein [Deltaproteobacteria bacterium]